MRDELKPSRRFGGFMFDLPRLLPLIRIQAALIAAVLKFIQIVHKTSQTRREDLTASHKQLTVLRCVVKFDCICQPDRQKLEVIQPLENIHDDGYRESISFSRDISSQMEMVPFPLLPHDPQSHFPSPPRLPLLSLPLVSSLLFPLINSPHTPSRPLFPFFKIRSR